MTGPDETALIEARDLVKVYGRRTVVDHVSFHVRPGEIVGLLGKNGAGKTTTFRMTMGLVRPDGGTVTFRGRDVTSLPMHERARLGMGYLSQQSSVFRYLTVEQNILAILERTGRSRTEQRERLEELIARFGLERVRHSQARTLSGGERRRVEIARALVLDPLVILLDEPFSGVDPKAVADIQEIILELREQGIGMLITDHNVRETLQTTDRTYILEQGKILTSGTPEEIVRDREAREAYLGEKFQM